MSGQKIKMTIDAFGRPTIEAEGFTGVSCADATRGIEQALMGPAGDKVIVHKPEYYQVETDEQHITQRTGW